MKISELMYDHYLPDRARRLRANTISGYKSATKCHIIPALGDKELSTLTFIDVQSWVDSIPTPGGAKKAFKTLRQAIRWYNKRSLDKIADPTVGIELPKIVSKPEPVFSKEDTKIFLEGIKGHPVEAVCIAQLNLGLRKSEAFGLKWSDINFSTGCVTISRNRQITDGKEQVYPPKTEKSYRTLKFPSSALERLKELRPNGNQDCWLCADKPDLAAQKLKRYALKHNLPWVPMKNFRHSWATQAIEGGADITFVAKWMGHTDISTTYERYIQNSNFMVFKIAEVMENIF